jgi:uncharacterized OB-fold protein
VTTDPHKPVPEVTEVLRPLFDAAREGRLVVQRCKRCGERRFPPREICSGCLGREAEWVTSCGRGTIVSFNVMHQVYHPGFASAVPYAVVLVELEDGGRMLTNLMDCPLDGVRVGLPVEVVFEKRTEEIWLPQFRPRR